MITFMIGPYIITRYTIVIDVKTNERFIVSGVDCAYIEILLNLDGLLVLHSSLTDYHGYFI